MQFTNKQKWVATGVAIAVTATFLIVPAFRGEAQKAKRNNTKTEERDSTKI